MTSDLTAVSDPVRISQPLGCCIDVSVVYRVQLIVADILDFDALRGRLLRTTVGDIPD